MLEDLGVAKTGDAAAAVVASAKAVVGRPTAVKLPVAAVEAVKQTENNYIHFAVFRFILSGKHKD